MIKKIIRLRKNIKNWYMRPLERLGLVGDEITYYLKNGLRFTFASVKNFSSLWIVEEMLLQQPYTNTKVILQSGDVVVDVGGNCGAFSILQVKQNLGIHVYTYEPDLDNFKYLNTNVKDNKFEDSITTYQYAVVGDRNKKTINLFKSIDQSGGHSTVRKELGEVVQVPTISIEEITQKFEKIAILKVDCEGGEYDIFLNSPKHVFSNVQYIALEYHAVEGYSSLNIKKKLEEEGFYVVDATVPNIFHCFNSRHYSDFE